jgi:hypothetical protein
MTEFVILRQKKAATALNGREFTMRDLYPRNAPILEVLVDRGGCGELVYRWLDCQIVPETGETRRENLADFRTATSADEAILAVYFGTVDACVVSKESCAEVMHYNPRGLAAKLEVVRTSPPLLRHVIACPSRMEKARRAELIRNTAGVHHVQGMDDWVLSPPRKDDFKTLESLQNDWNRYSGELKGRPKPEPVRPPASPPSAAPVPAVAPEPPPAESAAHAAERRPL